jgi:hypothetical protein
MLERKELNRLVVATLITSHAPTRANELYNTIREKHIEILRDQQVRGFRSFVKILNTFEEVRQKPQTGIKLYYIAKQYRNL